MSIFGGLMEVINTVPMYKKEFICVKRSDERIMLFSYFIREEFVNEDYHNGEWMLHNMDREEFRIITEKGYGTYKENTLFNGYDDDELYDKIKESYRINVKNTEKDTDSHGLLWR